MRNSGPENSPFAMNDQVKQLAALAQKPVRRVIGLMSGTSFDGLDVALCAFSGSGITTRVTLLQFETVAYDSRFKEDVKSVFSKKQVDLEKVTLMNAVIGRHFGERVLQCLEKWGVDKAEIDLIASHGQTIFHAPRSLHGRDGYPNATLQIGDGDHLAVTTGIITISDFRQKHIAAGGEGAPLAVYGDYLIFSDPEENRILLNIGGIANFTFLPAGGKAGRVFSTDVGPGNTLMDQYIQQHFPGVYFDENAALASQGKIDETLLHALLDHPFFDAPFPKTTGPELFNRAYLDAALTRTGKEGWAHVDSMTTLCAFSAEAIARAIRRTIPDGEPYEMYVSGGGMHNPLLMQLLSDKLGGKTFRHTGELGIDPDAKEAVLFALLANETVAGGSVDFGEGSCLPKVTMGKISFPA